MQDYQLTRMHASDKNWCLVCHGCFDRLDQPAGWDWWDHHAGINGLTRNGYKHTCKQAICTYAYKLNKKTMCMHTYIVPVTIFAQAIFVQSNARFASWSFLLQDMEEGQPSSLWATPPPLTVWNTGPPKLAKEAVPSNEPVLQAEIQVLQCWQPSQMIQGAPGDSEDAEDSSSDEEVGRLAAKYPKIQKFKDKHKKLKIKLKEWKKQAHHWKHKCVEAKAEVRHFQEIQDQLGDWMAQGKTDAKELESMEAMKNSSLRKTQSSDSKVFHDEGETSAEGRREFASINAIAQQPKYPPPAHVFPIGASIPKGAWHDIWKF